MKKQVVVLVLAAVLVFGCAVGGTLALLVDKTDTVINTFTAGNVNITLTETDDGVLSEGNPNLLANSYKMVPGNDIAKNPTVSVLEGSEACWLFVKIDKSNTLDTYISYTVDSEWIQLKDNGDNNVDGVYYIKIDAPSAESVYSVLEENKVTVKNVTKDQLDDLSEDDAVAPTLSFTAYAIQQANVADNAYAAWTAMQDSITNP